MATITDNTAAKCMVCDEIITKEDADYPGLCEGCLGGYLTSQMMGACGGDWAATKAEMIEDDLARLKNDKPAIRVMRQYAALLRPGAGHAIFKGKRAGERE
jgi:hypothetical protein